MSVELQESLQTEPLSPVVAPATRSADGATIRMFQQAGWICFESEVPVSQRSADSPDASLRSCLGRPGLWRVVRHRGQLRTAFELPADLVADVQDDTEAGVDSVAHLAQVE